MNLYRIISGPFRILRSAFLPLWINAAVSPKSSASALFLAAAASSMLSYVPRKYCFSEIRSSPDTCPVPDKRLYSRWCCRGELLTLDHLQACPAYMGQKSTKLLIVLLLPAAAALLAAIHQVVVGNIRLVAAITAAMPDHEAFCVTLFRWVHRGQPAKAPPGNIGSSIAPHTFAAAMGLAPGHELRCRGLAGVSRSCTGTSSTPPISVRFLLRPITRNSPKVCPSKL